MFVQLMNVLKLFEANLVRHCRDDKQFNLMTNNSD